MQLKCLKYKVYFILVIRSSYNMMWNTVLSRYFALCLFDVAKMENSFLGKYFLEKRTIRFTEKTK